MKTTIIAEAGVNHNGQIELAKKLVEKAREAGADYVKFQTFKTENLAIQTAEKAEYQKSDNPAESQFNMLKRLEFQKSDFHELAKYCKNLGIGFMSSPFDLESIDVLVELQVDTIKIGSGEITNYPFLRKIGKQGLPVILSTGMSTLEEVKEAVSVFEEQGLSRDKLTLLQANTQYPTPVEDANLKAMITLRDTLGVRVGYSDHTVGIETALAAVALGAQVIEKHFTLDPNMEGPDHKASLDPIDLKRLVSAIRKVEAALGSADKHPSLSERDNIPIARKSIVAAKDIPEGEEFTENNLTTKRPGKGISPMLWKSVLGQKALKEFKADEMIVLK